MSKEIFTNFPINTVVLFDDEAEFSSQYGIVVGYVVGKNDNILLKINTIEKLKSCVFHADPYKTKMSAVVSGTCLTLSDVGEQNEVTRLSLDFDDSYPPTEGGIQLC